MLQVARSLPEAYYGAAEALAGRISRGEEGEIYAVGAFVRQRLALRLAADGVPIPPGWNVRPPREAELVELREQLAATRPAPPRAAPRPPRRSTPDIAGLRGLVLDMPEIPGGSRRPRRAAVQDVQEDPAPPAPPPTPGNIQDAASFAALWRSMLTGEN
ncbi:MAG TPA: hypothetical protein VFL93_07160 [Longimicrobiaceae bacterium]|nr:hypothetical protein [Longimicrobiaceae bacterium]